MISYKRLAELVKYLPETGELLWNRDYLGNEENTTAVVHRGNCLVDGYNIRPALVAFCLHNKVEPSSTLESKRKIIIGVPEDFVGVYVALVLPKDGDKDNLRPDNLEFVGDASKLSFARQPRPKRPLPPADAKARAYANRGSWMAVVFLPDRTRKSVGRSDTYEGALAKAQAWLDKMV